jgi:hypothetical protein
VADPNGSLIASLRNIGAPKVVAPSSRYTPSTRQSALTQRSMIEALRQAPNYSDQIRAAAAGNPEKPGALGNIGRALIDNPISKAVLAPLIVLDTGRRAAVSTARELTDLFDEDKNTTASVSDWFKQTKDTSYGFGTAFPMEGWTGRLVGLAGDVALDPLTYLTLGANVPLKAATMGGGKLSTALGTRYVAGRGGREALAGLVSRLGGSAELVQQIGAQGKRALRLSDEGAAMATKIGLPDSGLYAFGGKVRVPFSGPIADAIETGLVKTRLATVRTTPGEWLIDNFTPKGTSAQRDLKKLRSDLARGTSKSPLEAKFAAEILTFDNAARAVTAEADIAYKQMIDPLLNDPDVVANKSTIFQFLDTPQSEWGRALSESEQRAYDKLKAQFQKFHEQVEGRLQFVDKNFQLGKVDDYFPHMMTDEARQFISNNNSTRIEEIRQYLKINMSDPGASFKARNIGKGKIWFGVELTDKDVAGGLNRLNQIANENGFVGKFFETDVDKVLSKYGSHYAEQFGTAEFMLKSLESGMLSRAKQVAVYNKDWEKGINETLSMAKRAVNNDNLNLRNASSDLIGSVNAHFDALLKQTGVVGGELKAAKEAGKGVLSVADARLALDKAKQSVLEATAKSKASFEQFVKLVGENDLVVQNLRTMIDDTDTAIKSMIKEIDDLNIEIAMRGDILDPKKTFPYEGREVTFAQMLKIIEGKEAKASKKLEDFEGAYENVIKNHDLISDVLSSKLTPTTGTGVAEYDKVVDIVRNYNVRAKKTPGTRWGRGQGALGTKNIETALSDVNVKNLVNRLDPERTISPKTLNEIGLEDRVVTKNVTRGKKVQRIETIVNGEKVVTQKVLNKGTKVKVTEVIPGIRTRLSRGATTADNLTELREAGMWLLARDLIESPDKMKLILSGKASELGEEAGSWFARYENLTRLMEEADNAERIAFGLSSFGKRTPKKGSVLEPITAGELKQANKYRQATNFVKASQTVDDLQAQLDSIVSKFNDIPEEELTGAIEDAFRKEHADLSKKIVDAQNVRASAATKVPSKQKAAADRLIRPQGNKDIVADLADGIAEYYLYRETSLQFSRVADFLIQRGQQPTERMWNEILSQVSGHELRAQTEYIEEFAKAKAVVEQLRDAAIVREGDNFISRPQTLREELSRIFNAGQFKKPLPNGAQPKLTAAEKELVQKAELLSKHFPEFEAVWRLEYMSDRSTLFYKDARSQNLVNEILQEIEKEAPTAGQGRAVARGGKVYRGDESVIQDELGYSGVSDAARSARYQSLRGDIDRAMATLESIYTKKFNLNKKVTSTTMARELESQLKDQFRNKIDSFKERIDEIVADVDKQRDLAKKAGSKFSGSENIRVGSGTVRSAIEAGEAYGFSQNLYRALNGSDVAVNDLFADILGGPRLKRGTDYTPIRVTRSRKIVRESRGRKEYEIISPDKSYAGKLEARTRSRISGLNYLAGQSDLPTGLIKNGVPGESIDGRWVAGTWALNPDLYGVKGYTQALEEYADNLLQALGKNKDYATDIKIAERELQRLKKKQDIGPAKRVVEAKAKEDARNAPLMAEIAELKNSPEYPRALRKENEQIVAMELAGYSDEVGMALTRMTPQEYEALWLTPNDMRPVGEMRKQLRLAQNELERIGKPTSRAYAMQYTNKGAREFVDKVEQLRAEVAYFENAIAVREAYSSAMDKFGQFFDNIEISRREYRKGTANPKERTVKQEMNIILRDDVPAGMEKKALDSAKKPRRDFLVDSYSKSPEYEHLNRIRTAEAQIDNTAHNTWYDNTEGVTKAHDDLRNQISELKGKQQQHTLDIQELQNKVYQELKKTGEPKAAYNPEKVVQAAQDRLGELRGRPEAFAGMTEQSRLAARRQLMVERDIKINALEGEKAKAKGGARQKIQREIDALNVDPTPAQLDERVKELVGDNAGTPARFAEPVPARLAEIQAKDVANKAVIERQANTLKKQLLNLNFEKITLAGQQKEALREVAELSTAEKKLLAKRMKLVRDLDEALVSKKVVNAGKAMSRADKVVGDAYSTLRSAQSTFDIAVDYQSWGPQRILDAERDVADVADMLAKGRAVRGTIKKVDDAWIGPANEFIADAKEMIQFMNQGDIPTPIKAMMTNQIQAQSQYLKSVAALGTAQEDKLIQRGIKEMITDKGLIAGADILIPEELMGVIPPDAVKIRMIFDEGYVALSKSPGFENIGVRKELQEIFQNVHRINEPQTVRELNKFLGKYTRFFKAYATLSPGFHLRNTLSNTFMQLAAGGSFKNLAEGLEVSRLWIKAFNEGKTVEQWLATLPAEQAKNARTAWEAAAASGGGITADFMQGTAPKFTQKSKEFGQWIEQHSRFMMAYDGAKRGMDMQMASARVKRFLIDYNDVSTADQYLRQIIPFWMWTSRNLPMQIGNMWLNPRAYATYNNIKRNLSDDQEDDIVPQWMQEMGAFKLPFGNNLYATPDLGFNRIGQTIDEIRDPRKFMSNINPAIKVPMELLAGKQFFTGREFSKTPIQVETGVTKPVASVLQPLLEGLGFGETGANGEKFVNEAAFYALRGYIPPLATAERLMPSTEGYQARGAISPLLGWLGIPGRQLQQRDIENEAYRRRKNIADILALNKVLEGEE